MAGGVGVSATGTRQVLDTTELLRPGAGRDGIQWRAGPALPVPQFGAGVVELAGQPVLLGGRTRPRPGLLHQSAASNIYQGGWRAARLRLGSARDQAASLPAPPRC